MEAPSTGWQPRTTARCSRCVLWLLVVWPAACGTGANEGEPEEIEAVTAAAEPFAPEPSQVEEVAMPPVVSDLSLTGTFAHEPHRQVSCDRCHETVPGHTTHVGVTCTDCHAAPVAPEAMRPTAEIECLRCHHVEERTRECAECHSAYTGPTLSVAQTLVSPEGDASERVLSFDHDVHGAVACSDCHASDPLQTLTKTCADCHTEHHTEEAVDCASCHFPSPLEAHEADAHRGCSGAGCHTARADAIAPSRAQCLMCHVAQADHEVGGDCSTCHVLTGAPLSRSGDPRGRHR